MGFDNTTENATDWQISIIESLIPLSYIPQQEKDEVERMIFDTELKYEEADAIITYLKANSIPTLEEEFNRKINDKK
jgi:hypothetical protein|tara:strand:+ start:1117 stop:1347 length:231 start_codon:yes stop_codon:yes gene_type:complete